MSAMSRLAAFTQLLPQFAPAEDGVWQGGNLRSPTECRLLLDGYLSDAQAGDWWAAVAKIRADELEAAMRAAGIIDQQRDAA